MQDGCGNAANLSLTGMTQTGPQIDTTAPLVTVTQVLASPGSGELPGNTVTVTGTPTLTLNDGSTATDVSGTGSNAMTSPSRLGRAMPRSRRLPSRKPTYPTARPRMARGTPPICRPP